LRFEIRDLTTNAYRKTRFVYNRIVPCFDLAIGNTNMSARIGVNAIAIAIEDINAINIDIIRAQHANSIIRGIANGDVFNRNMLAPLQSNWFGVLLLML